MKQNKMLAGRKASPPVIENRTYPIAFITIAALIFAAPFFRGLFFDSEMFTIHIITAVILIVTTIILLMKGQFRLLETPLDWVVFALVLAYLLSFITAVDLSKAVYGELRIINYFVVYWIVSRLCNNLDQVRRLFSVIVASAVAVALFGLAVAAGIIDYNGAMYGGQISSTLQYPNTLAEYMVIASLLGLPLIVDTGILYQRILYAASIALMWLIVAVSLSKGVWISLFIGLLVLLIVLPGKQRWSLIYNTMVLAIGALLAAKLLQQAINPSQPHLILAAIILIIVIAASSQWLEGVLEKTGWMKTLNGSKKYIIIIVIISLFAILGLLLKQMSPGGLNSLINMLRAPGETLSFTSRSAYFGWGLAILADHPITGVGAGGWNALYHQYQDYLAYSTLVHNHFVQIAVESGILGFICFVSIFVICIYSIIKMRYFMAKETNTSGEGDWIYAAGLLAVILAMGFHAAIDFDLSLGAIAFILWSMFGLTAALTKNNLRHGYQYLKPAIEVGIVAVISLVLLINGCSYAIASSYYKQGDTELQQLPSASTGQEQAKILVQSIDDFSYAVKMDGLNGMYLAKLATVKSAMYQLLSTASNPEAAAYRQEAITHIESALQRSPYDLEVLNSILNSSILIGDIDHAITISRRSVLVSPLDINTYSALARSLYFAVDNEMKQGKPTRAQEYTKEMLGVEKQIQDVRSRIPKDKTQLPYWSGAPLEANTQILFDIARAQYLVGNYTDSLSRLDKLSKFDTTGEITAWYAAALYRDGKPEQGNNLARTLNPDNQTIYNNLVKK